MVWKSTMRLLYYHLKHQNFPVDSLLLLDNIQEKSTQISLPSDLVMKIWIVQCNLSPGRIGISYFFVLLPEWASGPIAPFDLSNEFDYSNKLHIRPMIWHFAVFVFSFIHTRICLNDHWVKQNMVVTLKNSIFLYFRLYAFYYWHSAFILYLGFYCQTVRKS